MAKNKGSRKNIEAAKQRALDEASGTATPKLFRKGEVDERTLFTLLAGAKEHLRPVQEALVDAQDTVIDTTEDKQRTAGNELMHSMPRLKDALKITIGELKKSVRKGLREAAEDSEDDIKPKGNKRPHHS